MPRHIPVALRAILAQCETLIPDTNQDLLSSLENVEGTFAYISTIDKAQLIYQPKTHFIMEKEAKNTQAEAKDIKTSDYMIENRHILMALAEPEGKRVSITFDGEKVPRYNKKGDFELATILSKDSLTLAQEIGVRCPALYMAFTKSLGRHINPEFVACCIANATFSAERIFKHKGEQIEDTTDVYEHDTFVTRIVDFKMNEIPELKALQDEEINEMKKNDKVYVKQVVVTTASLLD